MMWLRSAQKAQAAAAGAAMLPGPHEAIQEAATPSLLDTINEGSDDDVEGPIGSEDPFVTPQMPAKVAKTVLLTSITPASNVSLRLNAFPMVDDKNIFNKALVGPLQAIALVGYKVDAVCCSVQ